MRLLTALLVTAALAQTPVRPQSGPGPLAPVATDGAIAGRVIDGATGRPVPGVVVMLVLRPSPANPPLAGGTSGEIGGVAAPPMRVLVDASGRFVFTSLRPGVYDLTATKRGYAPGQFGRLRPDGLGSIVTLVEHERRLDAVVRVWQYGAITGQVTDDANEPVVGVAVNALRREYVGGELRLNQLTNGITTDDRGAYRLGSLIAGDYVVVVPSSTTTIPQGLADSPQTSSSGGRDSQRAGDWVIAGSARSPVGPDPSPDGKLNVYPPAFSPELSGPVPTSPLVSVGFGETRTVATVRLRPVTTVRVSGTVTTPEGAGRDIILQLIPQMADGFASESAFPSMRTNTDNAGNYLFLGVTPGTYRLRAYTVAPFGGEPVNAPPQFTPRPTPQQYWLNNVVTVTTSDLTLPVAMRVPLTVNGRLLFDGATPPKPESITRGVIGLSASDGRSITSISARDPGAPSGLFKWTDMPSGRYVFRTVTVPAGWFLHSATRGGRDIIDVPIDVVEDISDIVVTFTDQPAPISGTVRAGSGQPDPDALVIIFPVAPERWVDIGRVPIRLRSVRADQFGVYRIAHMPPGDYLIAAVSDAAASSWQSPQFLSALRTQAARVRIERGVGVQQDLRRQEIK